VSPQLTMFGVFQRCHRRRPSPSVCKRQKKVAFAAISLQLQRTQQTTYDCFPQNTFKYKPMGYTQRGRLRKSCSRLQAQNGLYCLYLEVQKERARGGWYRLYCLCSVVKTKTFLRYFTHQRCAKRSTQSAKHCGTGEHPAFSALLVPNCRCSLFRSAAMLPF